jgi:hypothetical protein
MKRNAPDGPVALTAEEINAIKATWDGRASEYQQRLAMQAIIHRIAEKDRQSYFTGPSGDRDTAFAEGRRFVGLQLETVIGKDTKTLAAISTVLQPKP